MIEFSGHGILLDIEGTTSSIHFVYDVMFPFVRRELTRFLSDHWTKADVQAAAEQIARDAGAPSLAAWLGDDASDAGQASRRVATEVLRLMDGDVKATGLKQLQGLIWQAGFESGELRAHVYDDVPPALRRWSDAGCDLRIFSSGSVHAQKLFFAHSEAGNLLPFFRDHYDTTIGSKKEAASYQRIAAAFQQPAAKILFLSDVVAELDAARAAGLQTALSLRPGNPPPTAPNSHPKITSFEQVQFQA